MPDPRIFPQVAPFTCPHCATVTWRRSDAVSIRCRYCDRMYDPRTKVER